MSFEHKGCAEQGGVRNYRHIAGYAGRAGVGKDPSSMPPANPEAGANERAETLSESPPTKRPG